jgi:predicted RNA-binding Zn ribbon-like protein
VTTAEDQRTKSGAWPRAHSRAAATRRFQSAVGGQVRFGGEGTTNPVELPVPAPGEPVELSVAGGHPPAPGDLGLVQAFVNTFWDLDRHAERLVDPAALSTWLSQRSLLDPDTTLSRLDLARALDVRAGLHALLFANNSVPVDRDAVARLNRVLARGGLALRLDAVAPPEFMAHGRDLDAALALLASIVAVAQLDGRWFRLKACRGEHCGWAFYDHSRNQASNWCAMSLCGTRTKSREYRRRRR